LIEQARNTYDIVLMDTSGMSFGADSNMIAARAGAALVVGRMIETRVSAFREMIHTLTRSGVAVVGSVLNDPPLVGVLR
jgi:protein-tyrosine kinase